MATINTLEINQTIRGCYHVSGRPTTVMLPPGTPWADVDSLSRAVRVKLRPNRATADPATADSNQRFGR